MVFLSKLHEMHHFQTGMFFDFSFKNPGVFKCKLGVKLPKYTPQCVTGLKFISACLLEK